MCTQMNRCLDLCYIFESSPLKQFSRFDAERCYALAFEVRRKNFRESAVELRLSYAMKLNIRKALKDV